MLQIENQSERSRDQRLVVDKVRKEYPSPGEPRVVLDDVSFDLSPGETVAIVGPSGSGKSTLLNIIGSLDRPTSGSVRLGQTAVTELEGEALSDFRSLSVGFVFQDHHLLPQCSALENAALPSLAAGQSEEGTERARELLKRVGLEGRIDALPANLSGGERQRVAVARAMVNEPPLLLCDEPTGNLDKKTGARLGELFAELADEEDVLLVVVTHDPEFAQRFSPVLELHEGKLRESAGEELRG